MKITTLKNELQFTKVSKNGHKIVCRNFVIVICPKFHKLINLPQDLVYFGMKVSKKFSKKAVIRNKAKRRIRSIIYSFIKNSDILQGAGLIIIPRMYFNKTPFEKLTKEFFSCMSKEVTK